jgi:hypothetical protein
MGCYPLFACRDWAALAADLEALRGELVSLTVVADPFGAHDMAQLTACFPSLLAPYKQHYVADLAQPLERVVSKHHHYYARRALSRLEVDATTQAGPWLDDWDRLYAHLALRHRLTGTQRFSRESFQRQLEVPGLVAFRARLGTEVVGAHLWYVSGEVAYSHLAACDATGYETMASYALHATAVEHFRGRVRWLALGAGAGVDPREPSGLAAFKRGWSTGTRTAYLGGRIFDPATYAALTSARAPSGTGYFPAYRDPRASAGGDQGG